MRPGYDADLVVWDSHPLSIGATPLQVYIDGRATLNPSTVEESFTDVRTTPSEAPTARPTLDPQTRQEFCQKFDNGKTVITGITTSYLPTTHATSENLTLVLSSGKILCLDTSQNCLSHSEGGALLALQNGHISPGAIAISRTLGLAEIEFEETTGDGSVSHKPSPLDPDNLVFAKYGVHLDGRVFARARLGGVTRAVQIPMSSENTFLNGVSTGIRTSGNKTILEGGIWKDDIAVHITIGQDSKRRFSLSPEDDTC